MSEQPCPKCGYLVENGKLCPNCLLLLASQPTDALDADLSEVSISTDSPQNPSNERPVATEPDIETVRQAFPQLEILEKIGRGGMGTVFKSRQPKLDRFVALKILSSELAAKPTFADRFAREGKLLARLNHPNIVAVYDFGESGGFYFLLMEHVDGVNLRQAIREERFTPEQAIAIVPKICDALQYAHDEGVLHRDIKPENILLDTRGRVKIADFGIGKFLPKAIDSWATAQPVADRPSAPDTQTGAVLGTPSYMAPEQLDDPNRVDHRADIYSLGVVFYELLTGELPQGRFPPPSEKTPVGADIDGIVLKALHKERDKRQQSAEELKTEIETVTESPARNTVSDPSPNENPSRKFQGMEFLVLFFVFGIWAWVVSLVRAFGVNSTDFWTISNTCDLPTFCGLSLLIAAFITSCGSWNTVRRGFFPGKTPWTPGEAKQIGTFFWTLCKSTCLCGVAYTLLGFILMLGAPDPSLFLWGVWLSMLSIGYTVLGTAIVFVPTTVKALMQGDSVTHSRRRPTLARRRLDFLIGISSTAFVFVASCWLANTKLFQLLDMPSVKLLGVLFLIYLLWTKNFRRFFSGLLLYDDTSGKTSRLFESLSRLSLFGGLFGMIVGHVMMFSVGFDPHQIGNGAELAVFAAFYGTVLSVFVFTPVGVLLQES